MLTYLGVVPRAAGLVGRVMAARLPGSIVRRRRLLREVAIIAAAYFTYFGVRSLTEGEFQHAVSNAQAIVDFELSLGLFFEPTAQAFIVSSDWALRLANWVYLFGHWPIIGVVGFWLYRNKWSRYRLYRNSLIISGSIGLIIFLLYPVAPPRLIGMAFVDTVNKYSSVYHVLQPAWLTNQLAAVPSLHFGWNLIIGIVLVREASHIALRLLGVVTPVIMLAAIILTGNHYVIDAVVGGGVALIGLAVATTLHGEWRWPRPRLPLRPSPSG